ncbi:MAG: hypothetical protein JSV12_01025 [Candidatus Bathyarchaeota archaeon]|nr:MAG: hypothetical protein JSV12_01025 [Candidatus Bathyarchaeota archaeon]
MSWSCNLYTLFLKMLGETWNPPKYKPVHKLPFIPTEEEVNELIAGCNRKTSAFLKLLKETGVRSGRPRTWSGQTSTLKIGRCP